MVPLPMPARSAMVLILACSKPSRANSLAAWRKIWSRVAWRVSSSRIRGMLSLLILNPRATPGALGESLNHSHIGYRVFNRRRHISIVEDGLRKRIPLKGILVTDIQRKLITGVAILMPDLTRAISWSVERDFYLNPPLGSEDIHPLIRR